MNIIPKYQQQAQKSGWIVKFFFILGLLQVIICIVLGVTVAPPFISELMFQMGFYTPDLRASSILIGLAVGIIVGLFSGLVFFALSQVIDDLHAIRVQTSGYVSTESDGFIQGK